MECMQKMRELHIFQKKGFRILFLVELLLLCLGIAGLFGKDGVYELETSDLEANTGIYDIERGGYTLTAETAVTGDYVSIARITLPAGVYEVSLHYETDTDMINHCTVTDGGAGYGMLFTNGEHLYSGLAETDFVMWLPMGGQELNVMVSYGGEGTLFLSGCTIRETNALARMAIFWILVASLLVNAAVLYRAYDLQYKITASDKTITFLLGVFLLFASMPLMLDYMISGGDLVYHLMRIEGIRASLEQGIFPARNAPEWQQGYGYASAIFYGETLLYLAAGFRLIGFSVLTSYRLFFFTETAAQLLVAYYCFKKVFSDKRVGLLCAALYTLSVYRFYKTYCTGSFGEVFGVLFLPFFVYGFYRVFAGDIRERSYRKSWIPLTIGYAGLIQSHLLSGEMVGFFTIVLCAVEWKKVFRKETFLVLAKTVLYSCLLSAWFLVPFADYMLTGDFVIQHVSGRTIQERGLQVAHLFFSFPKSGSNPNFAERGMQDSVATVLGPALVLVFFLWLVLHLLHRVGGLSRKEHRLGWIVFGFGTAASILSLAIFPWDAIHSLGGLMETLVSSLQFPNRWLTIANTSFVTLAGVLAKLLLQKEEPVHFYAYTGAIVLCLLFGNVGLFTNVTYDGEAVRIYNAAGMGTGYISGSEYLPYGADPSLFVHRDPIVDDGVEVTDYEKEGLTISLSCSNTNQEAAWLRMPLLYYKGYTAYDVGTGEKLSTFADEHFYVTVEVPAGYSGELTVSFESPWYWRVAEAVSVLFFIGLLGEGAIERRMKRCRKTIARNQ